MSDDLAEEMRLHLAEPFPESVEKGLDYGEVGPVLIGADIYGWATRAGSLSGLDQSRLAQAADELERSIGVFPPDAQPYYERLAPDRSVDLQRLNHGLPLMPRSGSLFRRACACRRLVRVPARTLTEIDMAMRST